MHPRILIRREVVLPVVVAMLVVAAVVLSASGPVKAHPAEESWNNGPHCHTQLFGPIDFLLTLISIPLGGGFVVFITPVEVDCHGYAVEA